MHIWSILLQFHVFYGHFVYCAVILVHFSRFGMLQQEKSGNPEFRNEKGKFFVRPIFLGLHCPTNGELNRFPGFRPYSHAPVPDDPLRARLRRTRATADAAA
jgi:hypothetical protein